MTAVARGLALLAFVAALVAGARPARADAARSFSIERRPAWVDPQAPDLAFAPPNARFGAAILLDERQRRFTSESTTLYVHRATKITSSAGVAPQSELRIEFDPSFQRLALHAVRVIRDHTATNVLRRDEVRIIQRETDLADRIYDGRLTALLFVSDVRVGDVVEYEYSVVGRRASLGGHVDISFDLARRLPVHALRERLLVPASIELSTKSYAVDLMPTVIVRQHEREYVWERSDVPAVLFEEDVPGWYDQMPWAQATDFRSWSDVARWEVDDFDVDLTPSPELEAEIERIRAAGDDDATRIREALRFVQDEVRYLGIELGANAYEPHPPSQVVAQRYGDCKDKALLLATILGSLGIDARPALVSTSTRRGLDDVLPSVGVFDHAIVRVRSGGKVLWFDATETFARGPIDERAPLPFERALVVEERDAGLAIIESDAPRAPTISITEDYDATRERGPAALVVRTVYRGDDADAMRRKVARTPHDELARQRLDARAADLPGIKATGPMVIDDDEAANVLLVVERFEIPDFWEGGRRMLSAEALAPFLSIPATARREAPLAVDRTLDIEVRTTVALPSLLSMHDHAHLESSALSLDFDARAALQRLELTYRLRAVKDVVDADGYAAHASAVRRMRKLLDFELDARTSAPTKSKDASLWALAFVLAFFGIACVATVVAVLLAAEYGQASKGAAAGSASGASSSRQALRGKGVGAVAQMGIGG